MTDVFGNYVVQKFIEHGTNAHRLAVARLAEGHMLHLSLQMYGCRVIQKIVEEGFPRAEVLPVELQDSLLSELHGHVMHCVRDQNANHVIQKCIEHVRNPPGGACRARM